MWCGVVLCGVVLCHDDAVLCGVVWCCVVMMSCHVVSCCAMSRHVVMMTCSVLMTSGGGGDDVVVCGGGDDNTHGQVGGQVVQYGRYRFGYEPPTIASVTPEVLHACCCISIWTDHGRDISTCSNGHYYVRQS